MPQAKKQADKPKATTQKKVTNYEKYKDKILECCNCVPCNRCLAREVCTELCKEKGIDPSKSVPPCKDAWLKWADKKA